jgi:HD-GYP domain-containing protein (c-di-GMP phosphodiesterase class II)
MRLAKPVYGMKGQILLNRGVELTVSYILGLKRHNVLAVVVDGIIDIDEQEAENILEERIRAQAMAAIQSWVLSSSRQKEFSSVVDSVDSIVDEILSGKVPASGLAEISTTDTYTFAHSIDVCAFSVYMGLNYGYKRNALLKLGIGSILHDLGKTRILPEILNKPGKLTDEEFEEIKNHPLFGYDMLIDEAADQLTDSSLEIVLNHHERHDGSGYPRGIRGHEISDMAAICALSDVYSAMTTERVYRKAFSPSEAYEMVMTCGDRNFKMRLVRLFATCVCPYPVGTLVLLSNGEIAQVTATNRNLPFRPVITTLISKERIDLGTELSLVIKRALTNDESRAAFIRFKLGK